MYNKGFMSYVFVDPGFKVFVCGPMVSVSGAEDIRTSKDGGRMSEKCRYQK